MSTDLVTLPSGGAVALPPPYVDHTGLDDVAALKPSNLILVQNTTRNQKDARPGQILDALRGTGYDSLTCVALRVSRSRVLFPPGVQDLDAEPLCRSSNGVVPSPFAATKMSTTCASCAYSQWKNRQRPECDEKVRFMLFVKELGLPFYFNVGGASIKYAKDYLQNIRQEIQRLKYVEKRDFSLYDFFFTLKTERIVGKFTYYVARFAKVQRVQDAGLFGDMFEQFVVRSQQASMDEEPAATNEATAQSAVSNVVEGEIVTEV